MLVKFSAGAAHLVRIRIYGIIGFSGFFRRASSICKRIQALILFVLAGFPVTAKRQVVGEIEILKIPLIP